MNFIQKCAVYPGRTAFGGNVKFIYNKQMAKFPCCLSDRIGSVLIFIAIVSDKFRKMFMHLFANINIIIIIAFCTRRAWARPQLYRAYVSHIHYVKHQRQFRALKDLFASAN